MTPEKEPGDQPTYQMTVDLNVLDHLGINLYSNIAAVLTEVVANAWDADAEEVTILIDGEDKQISIADDGVGMTVEELNKKYLHVGYRRRDQDEEYGKVTAKGRKVMGRKGLGKLSLFSIAEIIEVQSAKEGQSHGFRMSTEEIRDAIEKKESFYRPHPLNDAEVTVKKGTQITLKDVKRKRMSVGATALRKRLARRFSIIGEAHDFKIRINKETITHADREDLTIVQFLWEFGEEKVDTQSAKKLEKRQTLPNRLADWEDDLIVRGWIGTAEKPKQLDHAVAGNLNGVVVFSRGRLFHENILDKVNDGHLYTKYLTGQIEADFLDGLFAFMSG